MYLGGIWLTATQTISGDDTQNLITPFSVIFDNLDIFDPANPGQIIIPSTVSHARLSCGANAPIQDAAGSVSGEFRITPLRNGVNAIPAVGLAAILPATSLIATGTHACHLTQLTQLMQVTAGDVWTMALWQSTGQPLVVGLIQLGFEFYQ
jgi:hypothetical protein